jgi:hypothetical protein
VTASEAMQAFVVSLIGGVLFPLLPVFVELGVGSELKSGALSVTAVVYAAAIGMASRHQVVVFSGCFCATICAFVYAVTEIADESNKSTYLIAHAKDISLWIVTIFAITYVVERFSRHCVDNEPFLEF